MPITVICPQCSQRFDVPDSYQGREGACTSCKAPLRVPTQGAPAAPVSLAAPTPAAPVSLAAPAPAAPAPASGLGAQPGAAHPLCGQKLGQYTILRQLARPNSGVFLGSSASGPVAIKVVPPEIIKQNPTVGKRYLREARTLFNKTHPNVVGTLDAGEELGTFFSVMEYVEGQDLLQRLEERGPLPEAVLIPVAIQIAQGLAFLREQGLLHRNLKPEHILTDPSGTVVKVAGLGLIRPEDAEGAQAVTVKGAVVGTPAYMSPEQARADDLDIRSDLYTLGILLYQLLTGELPFHAKVVAQILRMVTQQPCPDVRDKAPEVSPGLAAVIAKLTEKKPADRYSKPSELLTDLRALQSGELVDGLPPIVGMSAGTAAGPSKVRATQAVAADADAKVKRLTLVVVGLGLLVLGLIAAIVTLALK